MGIYRLTLNSVQSLTGNSENSTPSNASKCFLPQFIFNRSVGLKSNKLGFKNKV